MAERNNLGNFTLKTGLPFPDEVSSIVFNEKLFMTSFLKTLAGKGIIIEEVKKAYLKPEYRDDIDEVFFANKMNSEILKIENLTGLFVKVPTGLVLDSPLYYCFILGSRGFYQKVLNVIKIEDNARVTLAKGCAAIVDEGVHSALTLIGIGEKSDVTSIMIHNWRTNVKVGAKTKVDVGIGSVFREYYVKLTPVNTISLTSEIDAQAYSRVEVYSSTVGHKNSRINHNTVVRLKGEASSSVVNVKSVAHDGAFVKHNIILEALADSTKGHVECSGLLLGNAIFETIPALKSTSMNSELTHEASLGRIKSDEIFYLLTRGLNEEEAVRLVVIGFLSQLYSGLPKQLREYLVSITRMFVSKTL
ncbi:MAG: SufD family Fe-S cluster assembly protein [Thermosphaera sp.]